MVETKVFLSGDKSKLGTSKVVFEGDLTKKLISGEADGLDEVHISSERGLKYYKDLNPKVKVILSLD